MVVPPAVLLAVALIAVVLLLAEPVVAADKAAPAASYNPAACQKSVRCGGGSVEVRYPFFLANATSVVIKGATAYSYSYCGYPGMAISCDDDDDHNNNNNNRAMLKLGGDNYTVLSIDYDNHTVTVADAAVLSTNDDNDCPRVTHNVTVPTTTWLNLSTTANADLAFFYDCVFTSQTPAPPVADVPAINCSKSSSSSSSSSSSFVVVRPEMRPEMRPQDEWPRACEPAVVAPVLRARLMDTEEDYLSRLNSDGFGKLLRLGFQLTWDPSAGSCYFCEKSGGQCSYDQVEEFIGCLCSDGRVRSPDCGNGSSNKNKKTIVIAGSTIAAGVLALLLLVMTYLYIRKRRQYNKTTSSSRLLKPTTASGGTPRSRDSTSDMESGSVHSLPTHHFTYEELEEATDSFSASMEIGDGGFGTVYKGHLRDGRVVAVKRLNNHNSVRRVEQFVNEAAILSRLRHPSLVLFYGCTSSRSREPLLVYEFVPNGTVADHLHGDRSGERALTWPLRLNVAVEAAAALAYLHAVEPPVVHRDVKTSNILLDAEFHVKVADFGLSRLFPPDATHVSTAPQGTPGYVDPEYHQCYQLTDRSDVYSFGVVLVELISSKPAVDVTRDRSEINLAGMAVSRIQQCQLEQLVDLELGYGADEATRKAMTMVAELAFRCLQQNGDMRPPIREVLDALRSIQQGDGGFGVGEKKKDDALVAPRSPDTVHAPWDSMSTTPTPSNSQ